MLRAPDEARRTAALRAARGHVPLILPTETIATSDAPAPPEPFAGLIATSANAAPWLARRYPGDRRPVLAVGRRTALALESAGFPDVRTGQGRAADLVPVAAALAVESEAPLLYAAGRVRLPDFEEALGAAGVPFAIAEVYDTLARDPDDAEVTAAFHDGPPDAVLLLSAGQGRALGRLLARHPRRFGPAPSLLCLSERVAAAVPTFLAPFVRVSPRPDLAALLDLTLEHRPGSSDDLCRGEARP